MIEPDNGTPKVQRIQDSALARSERVALDWLCARMPRWITPDLLTLTALASAAVIFLAYALSNVDTGWLWLAVGGYVIHWFGDSLDGSLARHRRIERPRYGYFIDHSCDGLAILLMLGGIGASPFVRVDVALLTVVAYLLLAVHTFLMAKVSGEFRLSHIGFGPTELRLVLIALTIAMFADGRPWQPFPGFSGFDLVMIAASAVMLAIFMVETWRKGRALSLADLRRGR